ncbi:MAG TPA: thiamine phosphate synthase [Nitrospiria bacterium]|nr:thiamine phosphate synthase [Nitrospiria bacterium]
MSKVGFNLYLITGRNQTGGRPLEAVVEGALAGGVRAVQLREKDLDIRSLLLLAEKLRNLTRKYGALLFINERADVCLAVDADGVHLRSDGLPPLEARKVLGPEKMIGVSCHTLQEAVNAEEGKADFITLGPVYGTPSKAGMGESIGLSRFQSAAGGIAIPAFALGGIGSGQAGDVMRHGAKGIAVISALMSAPDPEKEARFLLSILSMRA